MRELDYQQGSPEWIEFRRNKLTATDAPVIMGESIWKSAKQLWKEKLGLSPPPELNDAMRRGMALEEEARGIFEDFIGFEMLPKVIQSSTIDYLIASLDGISLKRDRAVEIKCMGKKNHSEAMKGKIPEYYNGQLQHQMYVCELDMIHFMAYSPENWIIIDVFRNEDYIAKMLEKEEWFWKNLQDLKWESDIVDYVDIFR